MVTDDPLISNERCQVPASVPQKMNVNPMITVSIHTSGSRDQGHGCVEPTPVDGADLDWDRRVRGSDWSTANVART